MTTPRRLSRPVKRIISGDSDHAPSEGIPFRPLAVDSDARTVTLNPHAGDRSNGGLAPPADPSCRQVCKPETPNVGIPRLQPWEEVNRSFLPRVHFRRSQSSCYSTFAGGVPVLKEHRSLDTQTRSAVGRGEAVRLFGFRYHMKTCPSEPTVVRVDGHQSMCPEVRDDDSKCGLTAHAV